MEFEANVDELGWVEVPFACLYVVHREKLSRVQHEIAAEMEKSNENIILIRQRGESSIAR